MVNPETDYEVGLWVGHKEKTIFGAYGAVNGEDVKEKLKMQPFGFSIKSKMETKSSRIKERLKKLEDEVSDLKKEVNVATISLQTLLDNSMRLVERLEEISSPQIFLREYSKVQKYLLCRISLVTEINCNLDICTPEETPEIRDSVLALSDKPKTEKNGDEKPPDSDFSFKKLEWSVKDGVDGRTKSRSENGETEMDVVKLSADFYDKISIPKRPAVEVEPPEQAEDDKKVFNSEQGRKGTGAIPKNASALDPVKWTEAKPFVPKTLSDPTSPKQAKLEPYPVSSTVTVFPNAQGLVHYVTPQAKIPPFQFSQPVPFTHVPFLPQQPVINTISGKIFTGLQTAQTPNFPVTATAPAVAKASVKTEPPPGFTKKGEEVKTEEKEAVKPTEKVLPPAAASKTPPVTAEPETEEPVEARKTESPSDDVEITEIPLMNISRVPGQTYQVAFDHLVSPGEFYVQVLCPELVNMTKMNKEIEAHFKTVKLTERRYQSKTVDNLEKKSYAAKTLGKYALVFGVDDSTWTRGEVVNWRFESNDDQVQVFFIDYGDTKKVSLSLMQPLPKNLMKYPKFATRCHLADVYPLATKSDKPMPQWTDSETVMFSILLENTSTDVSSKIVVCKSDGCYPDDSLPVVLFVTENEESVNNRMIEFDSAVSLEKLIEPPIPNSAIVPQKQEESVKVTKKNSLSDLGMPVIRKSPPLRIGQIVNVQITCLLRINRFYCIKEVSGEEEDVLQKLVSFMNKPENVEEMMELTQPPTVGELVIGKYSEDELWYRAKVTKADPENDAYKLLFLDYGNSETTDLENMRKMERKFLGFPFQLIECRIYDVEPVENGNAEVSMKYLYKRVQEGSSSVKIMAVISENNSAYQVELYDKDGFSISADLVKKNHARYKEIR